MVAQVVEVSVKGVAVKVHRIWCAIDSGTAVNPNAVEARVMGGIIMGLSAALGEEITIEKGRCLQSMFSDYPVLKLADAPSIEIAIVTSDYPLGGVGEAGVPATAPAPCNAIFKATGQRIHALPIRLAA